jgi:hypothetical protein
MLWLRYVVMETNQAKRKRAIIMNIFGGDGR